MKQKNVQSDPADKQKVIAIVGPTASGKTKLAIDIARRWNGEVISADSRQIYRGMDIGTGKVTKREMQGVPHHLLDVASPRKTFTIEQYQKKARTTLAKILAQKKLPVIAGGTGFYIDALLYNYVFPTVKPNPALRRRLEKKSVDALFKQLQKLDPRRAGTIDPHNKRRLVRALEIVLSTKEPVPDASQALDKETDYNILKIGLRPDDKTLKRNIRRRLIKRLIQGMIREVNRLHEKEGLSWKRLDYLGLEYRYISKYLRGLISKEEMMDSILSESWHYAKRQMTWFKKDHNVQWIENEKQAFPLIKNFLK